MKTFCPINLILIIIFTGCSSTHFVLPKQSAFDELNQELQGETGKIILTNDEVLDGKNIILRPDSTSWSIPGPVKEKQEQQVEHCISTAEIQKIVFKNNTRGMWEGFGFGAVGGLAALVIASTQWEKDAGGYGPGSSAAPYILAGVAATGGIIGAPIGALIGHTEENIFHQYINIAVTSLKDKSNKFVTIDWNGKMIDLPRIKVKHIERLEDKIIITLPIKFYKEVFE
jgi:hypothetical protein